ncbi:unnamed protein product [Ambrosiozyma monospora]|uniref:Unnamed protein product n=1 Tax=Ambrosiozyma monospora TaxID=43982 RepID=A0ACB5SVB0_AMBMO|nr:unnamed protein product [Ambrosiozyma monospora]
MLIVLQQQGQVYVKNFLGSTFSISRVLRQGDPLSPLLFALVMDPLNRQVSSSLEGIDTEDGLLRLKMILIVDDVIATVADEKEADTFHKLISEFESISNLRLNPPKSIAYGTVGVIKNWDIPIKKTTDDQFIYLGVPLNKVNWDIKMKKLVNRIPPLWDKALEVRTLYINTFDFSTLYYV